MRLTVRVRENPAAGRDFVVGDVHGEFPTLERLLPDKPPKRGKR